MNSIQSTLCKRYFHGVTKLMGIHTNFINEEVVQSNTAKTVRPFEEVPGPKPFPILGNIWRYMPVIGEYNFTNLFTTYEKMYHQFGPLVKEQIVGSNAIVHVFDPKDMLEVYTNGGEYPARRSHGILEKYRKERPNIYKNGGLFPSNGEEWLKFRELFSPILFNTEVAESFHGVLEDVTEDLMARILSISDSNCEVNFLPELFRWSLECVGAITLNRRLGCLSTEDHEEANILIKAAHNSHRAIYVTEIFQFLKSFNNPIYRKLVDAQESFEAIVDKYMREALADKENLKHNCLLSRMTDPKVGADYKEIFTMVLDMFLAGIDTTAYTTGVALYNLCKNPSVQENLRKDLMLHLPLKTTRISDDENVRKLRYLSGVYNETLRLNPVAIGNGRVLSKDLVLSGYKIPANTNVILQHQVASRQDQNFEEANRFLPERWNRKQSTVYHFLMSSPYGFDKRACIGKNFARREMFLAIGRLVRNFKIEYHYEDIGIKTELINVPDKPLKFRFIPVEN